jgi:hypothetical protein
VQQVINDCLDSIRFDWSFADVYIYIYIVATCGLGAAIGNRCERAWVLSTGVGSDLGYAII